MKYIADSIGNDYKNWGAGEVVFISAPTGSGKTTFILKNFLCKWTCEVQTYVVQVLTVFMYVIL